MYSQFDNPYYGYISEEVDDFYPEYSHTYQQQPYYSYEYFDPERQFGPGIPFQGGQFMPPGRPPGFPPGPPGTPPGQAPTGGPPTTPPPAYTPQQAQIGVMAVDPGGIRRCLFRFTYVWLTNRRQFWFYPVFVGRTSIAGYRWTGFRWVYFGIDLRRIDSFQCV